MTLVPGFSYHARMLLNHYNKPLTKQVPKDLVTAGNQTIRTNTLKLFLLMLQQKRTSYRNAQTNFKFAVTSPSPRRIVLRWSCIRFIQDWVMLGHSVSNSIHRSGTIAPSLVVITKFRKKSFFRVSKKIYIKTLTSTKTVLVSKSIIWHKIIMLDLEIKHWELMISTHKSLVTNLLSPSAHKTHTHHKIIQKNSALSSTFRWKFNSLLLSTQLSLRSNVKVTLWVTINFKKLLLLTLATFHIV